jgi:hypothetical protein
MAREQEQAGRYQVLASPPAASEPAAGHPAGALDANVVSALSHLAEVIDQGLQFWPCGGA